MTELWKTQIRSASFRGTPFKVEQHSTEHGRRIQSTIFPYREDPATDDLGRKQRKYNLTAYLIGDDYHRQRDNLIRACEKPGAGTLVHPVFGIKLAMCESCTPTETRTQGRYCSVDLTFVEAGETDYLPAGLEKAATTVSKALSVIDESVDALISAWNLEGAPSYALAIAEGAVANVGGWMAGVANPASPTGQLASIRNLADNAATLALAPAELGPELVNSIQGIFGPASALKPEAARDKLQAGLMYGLNVGGFADTSIIGTLPYTPPIDTTTESGVILNDALTMFVIVTRAAVIGSLAEVARDIEFEYLEQITQLRDALIDGIDALCLHEALTDELYTALVDLKTSLIAGLPAGEIDLPALTSLTVLTETPALVAAYRLYGSTAIETRAEEIISRNHIENPLFLPRSVPLKVLSA